jgi:hypothetical protein
MTPRTADTIIGDLKKIVGERKPLNRELWLEAAFYLSLLREDEAHKFNGLAQKVAAKKLSILTSQEKKNVAAAEVEIEATQEYVEMKNQEAKIYTIDELVRVAKKNSDVNY